MSQVIYLDIESAPRDLADIQQFMPADDSWKLGNVRDPEKVKVAIAEKRQSWLEDAALSPVTGRTLVVGALVEDDFKTWFGDEKALLSDVGAFLAQSLEQHKLIAGFNIFNFDLPWLIKKSWSLGVNFPTSHLRNGRYWNDQLIDLRDLWQLGDRQCHGSLDVISRFLGGEGKKGQSGKDFAQLWETDREKAISYLKNDLEMTKLLHLKMV